MARDDTAPGFTDAELAAQPVGYWTRAANDAVISYINARMGEFGIAQRHWWALFQVGRATDGLTTGELVELMRRIRPYVDAPSVEPAVAELVERALLVRDTTGRLTLTDSGAALRDRVQLLVQENRARIHAGIPDEDYVTTVKVLRRMIENVGGNAEFH
ncbi:MULTISPECIES: MarR family winged helix-turn-helix transcriptional regulator [Streptomycetaceae]|uniref:MarR family transcriptional regulator n=1 Tax=Streptantibioticus cattleyicolor (strain ATCC 35852 / DSM 46488 / JCM 4925 / NBRC 14057 / NRRL 8057) TaxID=1003195 RepID=F8K2S2_STREN|nr:MULTISPECIES: hypothetical protein [Streptomycetaceae]AEW95340.1 hypothetical protein SCATT_29690 [Streptantibioticus cattleyicolor NRRL 8057 = DSM 46488]MYS59917.1 hypothetical protein [Streptomyces sp. SID5468]CCB75684.1 conserved protein of unknown function [Streptantibioticus cattleyicolor NRRL 8057 = DSM 46488]